MTLVYADKAKLSKVARVQLARHATPLERCERAHSQHNLVGDVSCLHLTISIKYNSYNFAVAFNNKMIVSNLFKRGASF